MYAQNTSLALILYTILHEITYDGATFSRFSRALTVGAILTVKNHGGKEHNIRDVLNLSIFASIVDFFTDFMHYFSQETF